ncbi:hypothetical protein L1987_48396 [Smallanthus sonchifolius]|uniref:Uncharacterized protein n=1 Tax=Smallanthus sonchifolius TaxID=185202 RepID=A0ACB9FRW3_9ASTR|nr:hypothetical protein L1987_48396 [Smallanthus sonchifolius]
MSSANSALAPLQPVVSDDEVVQEEPDQVLYSEPEEESEEDPMGGAEVANSDTHSGETVPYSARHGEDTSSEEVRPPTPSPPWSPSPVPLRSEWIDSMGLARLRTACITVIPPKKRALSSTDAKPLSNRNCLLNRLGIWESSHKVRPQEVGPTKLTIQPSTERSEPQPDPGAQ